MKQKKKKNFQVGKNTEYNAVFFFTWSTNTLMLRPKAAALKNELYYTETETFVFINRAVHINKATITSFMIN